MEDIFTRLAEVRSFTKLDLNQANQQIPLNDQSQKFSYTNTNKGLFHYTRLPYVISSSPGIFQRVMDNLLKGIQEVVVYLDDILVTEIMTEEHCISLQEMLN